MSDQNPSQIKLALMNARSALQHGQKMDARRWSMLAIHLDPTVEEPWLILAAISSPQASVAYLQKALQINPHSERAAKGMQWALNRLSTLTTRSELTEKTPGLSDTQPIVIADQFPKAHAEPSIKTAEKQAERKTETIGKTGTLVDELRSATQVTAVQAKAAAEPKRKAVSTRKPARQSNWAGFLLAFFFLALAIVIVWAALPQWNALARSASAPMPADVLAKPSLTPTYTATATPTSTPTPTATFTSTPTRTPKPTNTPVPPPTATPYVYNPPADTSAPVEPAVDTSGRWIDIDLSQQMLYAYEGDTVVNSFLVSTGVAAHPTVVGQFYIYVKYLYTDMSGPGYYLPDVPYTMYFYQGYGIHGTYWHHNFGTPMSHGCINMETNDAAWMFNFASVGTLVNIHY